PFEAQRERRAHRHLRSESEVDPEQGLRADIDRFSAWAGGFLREIEFRVCLRPAEADRAEAGHARIREILLTRDEVEVVAVVVDRADFDARGVAREHRAE